MGSWGKSFLRLGAIRRKGVEFAVLFFDAGGFVFDELRGNGEDEAVGGDEFYFEGVVIVDGCAVDGGGEAVVAVFFMVGDAAGGVRRARICSSGCRRLFRTPPRFPR